MARAVRSLHQNPRWRQSTGVKAVNRSALTFASAAIVGTVFLKRYPFPDSDALVQLILQEKPYLFHALRGGWVVMLFSTPALAFSGIFSLVFIFTRYERKPGRSELPPYASASASGP